jgi:hypothetical protein
MFVLGTTYFLRPQAFVATPPALLVGCSSIFVEASHYVRADVGQLPALFEFILRW